MLRCLDEKFSNKDTLSVGHNWGYLWPITMWQKCESAREKNNPSVQNNFPAFLGQ